MKLQATLSLALALILLASVPGGAIVGGNPTTAAQYPYYVKLEIHKYEDPAAKYMCGGSVVDPGWILTAAHCMTEGAERHQISIDVLVHDAQRYDAVELIIHPLWDGDPAHGHDLALVRIPRFATEAGGGIPEATKVRVGAPADPGAYADGVIATIVGHGETYWGSGPTPELRDLHIPLHSDQYMSDIYDPSYWYDSWQEPLMIGAGWRNHTGCRGDSGGPLTVDRNGVTVQVGVFSFFFPPYWYYLESSCFQPGAYTELSGAQMAWVAATVPGVAARWGWCAPSDRGRFSTLPGRWVATYVDTGSDSTGPDKDGTFRWTVSCVRSDLRKTTGSGGLTVAH